MQALAVSPTGEICVFSQRRIRRRSSEVEFYDAIPIPADEPDIFPERSELSRSAADDPLDDSFLSTSYKKHSSRSQRGLSKSAASTPPSVQDPDLAKVVKLNENMAKRDGSFYRSQNSYRGFLDGTLNALTFSYLSQKYKSIPQGIPDSETIPNIRKVFDQNAIYAQRTGSYRVAQTWRIFGALVTHELTQGEFGMSRKAIATGDKMEEKEYSKALSYKGGGMQRPNLLLNPALGMAQQRPRTSRSARESSSSVLAPPARVTKSLSNDQPQPNNLLANPDMEKNTLRSSLAVGKSPTRSMMSTTQTPGTLNSTSGHFNEPELYLSTSDINARKAQMANWRATPRIPLDFNVQSTSYRTESQRSASTILDPYSRPHKQDMSNVPESFDRDLNDDFILPAITDGMPQDTVGPLPDASKVSPLLISCFHV
jgi:hypothetical protein